MDLKLLLNHPVLAKYGLMYSTLTAAIYLQQMAQLESTEALAL
jgi:hypothetical protein